MRARSLATLLVSLWLSSLGCASGGAPGILERDPDRARITSDQLDAVVASFASEFATTVTAAADEAAATTADPGVRRQTLLWKTAIVPQVYVVASAPDPALSLVDLWTLAEQQRALLASPAGAAALGAGQPDAIAAADRLVQRSRRLVERTLASQDAADAIETIVTTFAAQHPMRDFGFVRESIVPDHVQLLTAPGGVLGELAAARDIAATATALAVAGLRHGPELARWQGELAWIDASRDPFVSGLAQSVEQLSGSVSDIGTLASRLPATIAQERTAAFDDIGRLQDDTVRAIDTMRVETLGALSLERQIVLDALRGEREAVLAALQLEIARMAAALSAEREALAGDLSRAAAQAEEDLLFDARALVDHAFLRAIQLLLGIAAAALLTVGAWRVRQRQAGRAG